MSAALASGGDNLGGLSGLGIIPFTIVLALPIGAIPGLIIGLIACRTRPDTAGEAMLLTAVVLILPGTLLIMTTGLLGILIVTSAILSAGLTFLLFRSNGFSLR